MIKWINKKSYERLKHCLPEDLTVKKCLKATVYSICKYVDDLRQKINESLYPPPDKKHTVCASFLTDTPIVDLATIEERIK